MALIKIKEEIITIGITNSLKEHSIAKLFYSFKHKSSLQNY
jgi:hypothetical protein